jgi:hypothetical protein
MADLVVAPTSRGVRPPHGGFAVPRGPSIGLKAISGGPSIGLKKEPPHGEKRCG